jgi:hypothetical protein
VALDLQRRFKPETLDKSSNRILRLPFGLYKIVCNTRDRSFAGGKLEAKKTKKLIKVKCAAKPAKFQARIKHPSEPL